MSDGLQRRTLSLFPNGQVAEYELIYTVELSDDDAGSGCHSPTKLSLYRDYQDDPSRALAKARELDLIAGRTAQSGRGTDDPSVGPAVSHAETITATSYRRN